MSILLQKHQSETVKFLSEKCVNQHGLLIYHNMGTGKTLTSLFIILKKITDSEISIKDILIVCPSTIQSTWIIESMKLNLNLKSDNFLDYEELNELIITSGKKNKNLFKGKFLVLDECHHILPYLKKEHHENYFLFLEILNRTQHCLLLTGTPFYYSETGDQSDISYLLNICEGDKNNFPIREDDWKKRYMDKDLIEKRKKSFYFNWIQPSIYKVSTIIPAMIGTYFYFGGLTIFSNEKLLNEFVGYVKSYLSTTKGMVMTGACFVLIVLVLCICYKVSIWTDTGSGDVQRAINLMKLDYSKIGADAGRYISFFKNEQHDPNFAKIIEKKHFESSYSSFQAELCFKLYFNILDNKYKKFITGFSEKEEIVKGNILNTPQGTLKYSICIGNLSPHVEMIIDNNLQYKVDPNTGVISIPELTPQDIKSETCNKFKQLKNHILKSKGKRIVISSLFTEQGAYLLSMYLNIENIPHLYLNNKLSIKKRIEILNLFNNDKFNIIIIDKSSSEGVSLLRVSEIHLLEPISNISLKDQIVARGVRYKSHEGIKDPEVNVYTHVSVMSLNSTQINDFKTAVANKSINLSNYLMYSSKLKKVFDSNLRGLIPRTNWSIIDKLINPIQVLESTGLNNKPDSKGIMRTELNYRVTPDNVVIDLINIQKISEGNLSKSLIKQSVLSTDYKIPNNCISSSKTQRSKSLSKRKSLSNKKSKSLKAKSVLKRLYRSHKKKLN